MAVCGQVDHDRARYSQVQPGKAKYSQVQPGTALKRPIIYYILKFRHFEVIKYDTERYGDGESTGASSEACLGHILKACLGQRL